MLIRLIITVTMIAAAVVSGYVYVLPKYREFQSYQIDFEQKKTELGSKTAYYIKINEIWDKLEGYGDALDKIDSALPVGYSTPVLFNYFQKTAGGTGLGLNSLSLSMSPVEKIKEINISLELSGSYSSLKNFISAIESSDRFFIIKNISFSSPGEGEEIFSFNLDIAAHSY